MKKKTTYTIIGVIAIGALGYYLYSRSKNKKVQDVKKEELKDAANGVPAGVTITGELGNTPKLAIAIGEPIKMF